MDSNQKKKTNQDLNLKKKKQLNDYARYSSLGFQMIFIILVGVLGGLMLDKFLQWKFPVFTVVLSIISVPLAIYYAIKDLIR